MEALYFASTYGVFLLLIWFAVVGLFICLTGALIIASLCFCTQDKYEAEFIRQKFLRIAAIPFGVLRKEYIDNEAMTWWIMFLFAIVELCLGTVFLLGFTSIYFTVCFYGYTYLGKQIGITAEWLCLFGFIHLNLPVTL